MTLALIAALTLSSGIADYFPVAPGTKWMFETQSTSKETSTDLVSGSIKLNGKDLAIFETKVGSATSKTLYLFEDDTLYIAGFDPAKLLPEPYPILKFTEKSTSWTFSGKTQFYGDFVPLSLSGKARFVGKRSVLSEKRDCIEVKLIARVEGGPSAEIVSEQTSLYAKGVGLVEMRESTSAGTSKQTRKTVLVSFEAPTP